MPPILLHLPPQTQPALHASESRPAISALPDLAVFHASGADAISFLQGQITNDIAGATTQQAKLAGYCTAQGRLLATMVLCPMPEPGDAGVVVQGILKQDLSESVLKRLGMFVLRAKVKLALSVQRVYGVTAQPSQLEQLQNQLGHPLPLTSWEAHHSATGTWICAPGSHAHRWWWIATPAQIEQQQALFTLCQSQSSSEWYRLEMIAGIPWIEKATQDVFIPQTLNLDLIEGVSFTKGCYPGQEIVARSHYRGTLKKRMALGKITGHVDLLPGSDIYDRQQSEQPCGRLICTAATTDETHLLFEATFEAMDHNALAAGQAEGPEIQLLTLPYPLRTTQP